VRSQSSETLISNPEAEEKGGEGNTGKEGKGFFACYLLISLSPRHKGQTYIGFAFDHLGSFSFILFSISSPQ
jgi:hypothetical protein